MNTKIQVVKNMGLSWTLYRAKYELQKKMGLLKKQYPVFSYNDINLQSKILVKKPIKELVSESLLTSFFQVDFQRLSLLKKDYELEEAILQANGVIDNKFVYFSKHPINFDNVDWHYSPLSEKRSPHKQHWTEIGDLSSDFGDIKWIWELSRFSFTYPLARAYSITRDEKYAKTFWSMFEDFIVNNPPELGANYKCGQEMSLRIMAWTFGMNAFIDSPETTEDRLELMMKAIYHHADHVEKHFDFALKSVKNNHSLSEAAGMYTVGTVFPFFNLSQKWKKKGEKFIQTEAAWQIYEDGSYIQHSFNYQRLAIQDLTWVLRLAQINGEKFDATFLRKFQKTVEFMYQMQEPKTGKLPNYGMNDGAYIHPFTSKGYLDHRPALQAAWLTLTDQRLYAEIEVDEIAVWLDLDVEKTNLSPNKVSKYFEDGGYATLRKDEQFAMIRCATYKHRPAQADMLHIDFWDREFNLLTDAGTFSYNTKQNELLYFNGTASHNTVMINEKDQMTKASRFIWLNWTKSKVNKFEVNRNATYFEGEHYGYSPITHRRAVLQQEDTLIVVDDLLGEFKIEKTSLSWLFGVSEVKKTSHNKWTIILPDNTIWTMEIISSVDIQTELYRGSETPVAGWKSLYYGHKEASPQLIINSEITEPSRFITVLRKSTDSEEIKLNRKVLTIGEMEFELSSIGSSTVFKHMELSK